MGILLVYDVTDEASFSNIRNWMRQIEQHASDSVKKVGRRSQGRWALPIWARSESLRRRPAALQVLVGNKCDMDESKRVVPYSKGQALADEFGIPFFETSAKANIRVDEVGTRSCLTCSHRMGGPCCARRHPYSPSHE